jgi:putative membrane protein
MNIKKKFTESDLKRINDAVKVAEDKISGEIVPVIVDRSGEYVIANYKGCLLGASLAYVTMILLDRYVIDPSHTLFYDPVFIFAVVILAGVLGAWIPAISDPVKRFLVTQRYQDHGERIWQNAG